jgi:SpoIID/LytB domain protein
MPERLTIFVLSSTMAKNVRILSISIYSIHYPLDEKRTLPLYFPYADLSIHLLYFWKRIVVQQLIPPGRSILLCMFLFFFLGGDPIIHSQETLFRKAVDSYYEGNLEESIRLLESALQQESAHTEIQAYGKIQEELIRLYQEIGPLGARIDPTAYQTQLETWGKALYDLSGNSAAWERELFICAVLAGHSKKALELLPLREPTPESYLYQGILSLETEGNSSPEQAVLLFQTSLKGDDSRPATWYFLGNTWLTLGNLEEATICFRTALRKDGSFLPALTALMETVLLQGNVQEGYTLLNRLQNILPFRKDISKRILELETEYPELRVKVAEKIQTKRVLKEPPRTLPFTGDVSRIPRIRVALALGLSTLSFKIASPYLARWISPEGTEDQEILEPGIYKLLQNRQLGDTQIRIDSTALEETDLYILTLPSSGSAYLEPQEPGSTVLLFDLSNETGSFIATVDDRSFRGSFQILQEEDGFTLINHINIEEYLYSVLPSEMPAGWPPEALKAQAIAARSYSLAMMERSRSKPFDVYGSTRSAAYRGVGSEHPNAIEAVDATRGIYLREENGPFPAFYSANSGGYGEGAEAVWGSKDPNSAVPDILSGKRETYLSLSELTDWLRSYPLSYSSQPSFHYPAAYRWERWVTPEEIRTRLGTAAPAGRVTAILTRGRSISGRVREVEIQTEGGSLRYTGDRVRTILGGLRSTLFTLRVKIGKDGYPEFFIFSGGGWGHGVGLDQSGAAGMAAAGFTAEQILQHYYPGATMDSYLD